MPLQSAIICTVNNNANELIRSMFYQPIVAYANIDLDHHWLRKWIADGTNSLTITALTPHLSMHFEQHLIASTQITILYGRFENYAFEITAAFPRGQWVNTSYHYQYVALYNKCLASMKSCPKYIDKGVIW